MKPNQFFKGGSIMFRAAFVSLALIGYSIAEADDKFQPIDIQPYANQKLIGTMLTGSENNLDLPPGKQILGDVKFQVGDSLILLGSKTTIPQMPEKVEGIRINQKFAKLHILHATQFGGGPNRTGAWHVNDGTVIGEYRINFEDHTAFIVPIVYGDDVRDWWFVKGEKTTTRGQVVWKTEEQFPSEIRAGKRIYMATWENPCPEKTATTIDYSSKKDELPTTPFCVAITIDNK
jgi:hypothetical protein